MEELAAQDKAASVDNLKDTNFSKKAMLKVEINGETYESWLRRIIKPDEPVIRTNNLRDERGRHEDIQILTEHIRNKRIK